VRKREESVFFFTIVDFLVTAIFLGLALFSLKREGGKTDLDLANEEIQRLEQLAKKSGAGGVRELTDRLSRLGPIEEVERQHAKLDSAGGLTALLAMDSLVKQHGGRDSVRHVLQKSGRDGSGLPPCLADTVDGQRKIPKLAVVIGTDSTIRFAKIHPAFPGVLATLGRTYQSVEHLTFRQFRRTFEPLLISKPNCRYSLLLIEETRYTDARDALNGVFYFTAEKAKK
jgi:hypothetical protein